MWLWVGRIRFESMGGQLLDAMGREFRYHCLFSFAVWWLLTAVFVIPPSLSLPSPMYLRYSNLNTLPRSPRRPYRDALSHPVANAHKQIQAPHKPPTNAIATKHKVPRSMCRASTMRTSGTSCAYKPKRNVVRWHGFPATIFTSHIYNSRRQGLACSTPTFPRPLIRPRQLIEMVRLSYQGLGRLRSNEVLISG